MSPEEEVSRAGQARDVLESPIFREACSHVRDGIVSQMERVAVSDDAMHTKLILTLQCWSALERYLKSIVETGDMADMELEQKRGLFRK